MNNYTLVKETYIDEIDSNIKVYSHNKSKARICTIKNNDKNKVFAIAFRTPPIDNSGLTHILEHSVLCGSVKFPVKDPFVEMIKSSVNTFLNAFTFPDKTCYPIASPLDKDYKNLMEVYMDAVFNPNIYKNENIFLQEGWHYHILDKNDPIIYNGVVYNEMKGVYSNPDGVLENHILKSLYPNNAYSLESGGFPDDIPSLSYESFKDFHKKYYSPSNSYIYLYGDLDMEERMDWLDKEYLSKYDEVKFDTTIKDQPVLLKPVYETHYYESMNDESFLSYNIMIPKKFDYKLYLALDLILDSLFNVPGAKLKKKIQDAGIATNVDSSIALDFMNPNISIIASGADPNKENEFIQIINDEFKSLADGMLDKDTILSMINHTEFEKREKSYSVNSPLGIDIILGSLTSWLYDDDRPYDFLNLVDKYVELKKDLNNNYFENVIKEYLINNTHKSFIKLLPKKDYLKESTENLAKKLEEYKNSLSDDELDKLILKNKELVEYQNSEEKQEDLDKLPRLSIDDLEKEPGKSTLQKLDNKYTTFYYEGHTNDISYIDILFDITDINPNQFIVISLYCYLLGKLGTNKHSDLEITNMVLNDLGCLRFDTITELDINGKTKAYIVLTLSAINNNIEKAFDLLNELFYDVNLDIDQIYKLIGERKKNLEMSATRNGHMLSLNRALSNYCLKFRYTDAKMGIEELDFLTGIYNNFNNEKDYLLKELNNVKNYFTKSNSITLITSEANSIDKNIQLTNEFIDSLNDNIEYPKYEFVESRKNEAIIIPANVNFVSCVGKTNVFDPKALLLSSIISKDYLWQNIRVLGGAYGAFLKLFNCYCGFSSYRDPNLDKTIDNYKKVYDYINNLDFTKEELDNYIISFAGVNTANLEHVRTRGKIYFLDNLFGKDYEYKLKNRTSILNSKLEDLKSLANLYKEILDDSTVCVLGSEKDIKESKYKFDSIRKLID